MEEQNLPNMADDAAWTDGVLRALGPVPATLALQTRVLAAFDGMTARRQQGLGGLLRRLSETIWPGAPSWQPAAVLAASLVIGIAAGTFLPLEEALADNVDQPAAVALDAPPSFELGENS
jgi:hypothetical protein